MSSIKRLLSLCLTLCLLLTSMAALAETPAVNLDEKLTITFTKNNSAPPDADATLMQHWNELFNVDLQYVNIERNSYNELIALKVTSGEIPDFFMLDGNLLQYDKFVNQGVLRSIPLDLFKRAAPRLYAIQEPYIKALCVDGELYALTDIKPTNAYPLVCIWREDWLKNVGIDKIPETLEEAEAAFYAFAQKDPDGNGKDDTYGLGKSGIDAVFGAFGGLPFGPWPQYWMWVEREDGTLVNAAAMPEMKEALRCLAKWYKDGVLDPEYVLGENKGGYWALSHDFINSKIGYTGLAHYYHWMPPQTEDATGGQDYQEFTAVNPTGSYAFGTPMVGPTGKSGTWKYSSAIGAAGMVVFGADVSDQKLERILHMMDVWSCDFEEFKLVNYGEQGVSYDLDENGNLYWLGDYGNTEVSAKAGIFINIIGNPEFYAKIFPTEINFAKEYMTYPCYESKLLVSLPSEAKYRSDLERLRDQYYTEIITGKKDVDAFDEFLTTWYGNGGQQLEDEANEWYATVK